MIQKIIYYIGAWVLSLSLTAQGCQAPETTGGPAVVVHQWVQHPALDRTVKGLLEGLGAHGYESKDWIVQSAQGNPALAQQMAAQLVAKNPRVVVAVGTGSAQALQPLIEKAHIPMIFLSVTDPVGAKLLPSMDNMPQGCITGWSNFVSAQESLSLIKKVVKDLKVLGMVVNPGEPNGVAMANHVAEFAEKMGVTVKIGHATRTSEVGQAVNYLMGREVQALFISNDNTALSALGVIARVASEHRIPLFVSDIDTVTQGALAALGPDQYAMGISAAEWVYDILNHQRKLSELAPQISSRVQLVWNDVVAGKLNIQRPSSVVPHRIILSP